MVGRRPGLEHHSTPRQTHKRHVLAGEQCAICYAAEPAVLKQSVGVVGVCATGVQGSEAKIGDMRPTVWLPYEHDMPNGLRVQTVLDWTGMAATDAPDLILMYFSTTDTMGHAYVCHACCSDSNACYDCVVGVVCCCCCWLRYGPLSPQVDAAAVLLDDMVGALLTGLRDQGQLNYTNIIVLADHGMATIMSNMTIFLEDYIDLSMVTVVDWSPDVALIPRDPATAQSVYDALAGKHPNLTMYLKQDIPER